MRSIEVNRAYQWFYLDPLVFSVFDRDCSDAAIFAYFRNFRYFAPDSVPLVRHQLVVDDVGHVHVVHHHFDRCDPNLWSVGDERIGEPVGFSLAVECHHFEVVGACMHRIDAYLFFFFVWRKKVTKINQYVQINRCGR